MIKRLRNVFPSFLTSILDSYTQVFFSNNKVFALILICTTFIDPYAGISGLVSVVFANAMAYLIGFNRTHIKAGYYGFNSLLVGLGMGIFYQPGTQFFVVLLFASLLTLMLTVMMEGVVGKYGLPFLSLSFLLGIWLVTLASRQFTALVISERGIYHMNEMYSLGGLKLVKTYNWFQALPLHESIKLYFRSLGAIFFQYQMFAGILVAIGLLIYSRIAFMLSLLGFFSAFFYYQFIGADIYELSYGYIGFNFILSAIAIGGYFIIPSKYSFLWVILLTPLISIILTSTNAVFGLFQLSVFSLPFNLTVLLFLYVLKFRDRSFTKPEIVGFQQVSPEKNLYSHLNFKGRFGKNPVFSIALPFWGEWKVTQAHNGAHTHQGDWRHAWDFEIVDSEGLSYSKEGNTTDQYYCFHKPVLAPAPGWIEEVVDDVEDNEIGKLNLEQNWGNTIVIRHSAQLFSKLSHLEKSSIKVKKNDYVKPGDVIASCGNSGRSPVPHLHFQLQATPFIGSKTLDYPIGHFILNKDRHFDLRSFEKPEINNLVSNLEKNSVLEKFFHFIPGQELRFVVQNGKGNSTVEWEVRVDAVNNSFLYCTLTKSKAWFRFDGEIHYFTHFEGDRKSMLYLFFLGAYKIATGFYKNLKVRDTFPLNAVSRTGLILLQDFIAPFWLFMKPEFELEYLSLEDNFTNSRIILRSMMQLKVAGHVLRKIEFNFEITNKGMNSLIITENNRKTEMRQELEGR